jgi:hypothetical protein
MSEGLNREGDREAARLRERADGEGRDRARNLRPLADSPSMWIFIPETKGRDLA